MRFSLKSSLLILAILGTGAGLLGRLFMTDPPLFFRISYMLVTVVPFVAAIAEPQDGVMPTPVKRWTQTISIESPVTLTNASLVTDPKKNPASGIRIDRLVVQNEQANQVANGMGAPNVPNAIQDKNRKKLALKTDMGPGLEVDIAFDVFVHVDESTMVNMGHMSFHQDEDGSSFHGSLLTGAIDQLDDDVTAVDIEFVPDLEQANKRRIFKEIWGKKIMLYDVPVERLDLEAR